MKKLGIVFALILSFGSVFTGLSFAAESSEVASFEQLKSAVEAGGEKEIVIKQDINFTDQIVLPQGSNITIKDDGSVRKLIYDPSMAVDDSDRYGKGLFLVENGAKLTVSGTSNSNLVFDGNKEHIEKSMDVTDNGVFITVKDPESKVLIEHASFVNSKNRGMKTAPILVKDGGSLVIQDVLIRDNLFNANQTTANYKFRDWDNNTQTIWSAKGSAIAIQSGGVVEINGGTIENNGLVGGDDPFGEANIREEIPNHNTATGAITLFGKDSRLVINDGIFRNNSAGLGGVVSIYNGAEAVINGGLFEGNRAIRFGGAIIAYSSFYDVESGTPVLNQGTVVSKIQIHGGTFKNNKAYKSGGGVLFSDWNSKTSITGGVFEGNSAPDGGAVVINDRWREGAGDDGGSQVYSVAAQAGFKSYSQWKWRSPAEISGGKFLNNHADRTGGAIYINSSDVSLTKALFEGNTSRRYGGAIYLSSEPHVLHLNNAYFEGNKAENTDVENIVWNHEGQTVNLYNGVGGALWYCPTGNTEFYASNSAGFKDNVAARGGDEYASATKLSQENAANSQDPDIKGKTFVVTIADRMLGGGKINWYKDGSAVGNELPRYAQNDQVLGKMQGVTDEIAIKGISSEEAQALARANASILFINNSSSRGGAVATNGTLVMGDKDKEFKLTVTKVWDKTLDEVKNNDETKVVVDLYNATDKDHKVLVDSLVLTKENEYKGSFENLPLEAGSKKITYEVLERGDRFAVSYTNNVINTEEVSNGDELNVQITNGKKSEQPEPKPEPRLEPKPEPKSNPVPQLDTVKKVSALPKTGDARNVAYTSLLLCMGAALLMYGGSILVVTLRKHKFK